MLLVNKEPGLRYRTTKQKETQQLLISIDTI